MNPNSSEDVTRRMSASLAPFARHLPFALDFATLADAPLAIESDADTKAVAPVVANFVATTSAAAHVVGCFSDPGVEAARGNGGLVIGIGEAGYLAALGLGRRFGVISILAASVRRHAAHIARLGLAARLAGDRPLGLGVADLANDAAQAAVIETGRALCDQDGADVLVLGCAGMGHHRKSVEEALGVPVIDPVQAAVFQAAAAVALDYRLKH